MPTPVNVLLNVIVNGLGPATTLALKSTLPTNVPLATFNITSFKSSMASVTVVVGVQIDVAPGVTKSESADIPNGITLPTMAAAPPDEVIPPVILILPLMIILPNARISPVAFKLPNLTLPYSL